MSLSAYQASLNEESLKKIGGYPWKIRKRATFNAYVGIILFGSVVFAVTIAVFALMNYNFILLLLFYSLVCSLLFALAIVLFKSVKCF
uniref:Uncharacterized protein n=1 Tax=Lactuca sativa TaxID=4236 RepID=A0A9R1XFF5_LACSA|nr:hypothetical protein LSAT_V11C500293720 [Lactuca sativa]